MKYISITILLLCVIGCSEQQEEPKEEHVLKLADGRYVIIEDNGSRTTAGVIPPTTDLEVSARVAMWQEFDKAFPNGWNKFTAPMELETDENGYFCWQGEVKTADDTGQRLSFQVAIKMESIGEDEFDLVSLEKSNPSDLRAFPVAPLSVNQSRY